jgi:hypothetical protein
VIDWRRLLDLRERRRRLALEAMLADRRAADACAGAARAAEALLGQVQAARTSHWQAVGADAGLSVASLAGAAAWSRVLDERIARERAAVAEAEVQARAQARVLAQSRAALRRAAGGVEKATRLSERARSLGRRLEDARLEATAEDVAAALWAARRAQED